MAVPQPDSMRGPLIKTPLLPLLLLLSALTLTGRPGRVFCSIHWTRSWEFPRILFSSTHSKTCKESGSDRPLQQSSWYHWIYRQAVYYVFLVHVMGPVWKKKWKWISDCLFKQLNFYFSSFFCQNCLLKLKLYRSDFLSCLETGKALMS